MTMVMSNRSLAAAFSGGTINADAHSQYTAKTSESIHAKPSLRKKLLPTFQSIATKVPLVEFRSRK
jgi:hypothetical protein